MNPQTIQERLNQQQQGCIAAETLWGELLPGFCPSREQSKLWILRHGFETLAYAIAETASKRLRQGHMTPDHAVRFASRVMVDRDKTEQAVAR